MPCCLQVRLLEGLFGFMISVMVVSFGIMYVRADVPTDEVIAGFLIPRLPRKDVPTVRLRKGICERWAAGLTRAVLCWVALCTCLASSYTVCSARTCPR